MPDAELARIYAALEAASTVGVDPQRLAQETATLRSAEGGGAVALPFSEPYGSIRLVAAPVRPSEDTLRCVLDAREAVLKCLASSGAVFQTPVHQFHLTVWHFGRPGDSRPTDVAAIDAERAALASLLADFQAFAVTIDRLLLSDSGVLILLYQTHDGAPLVQREKLRAAFPESPSKQTVILHSSLARLLQVPSVEELAAARQACRSATEVLHGRDIRISSVYHVVERSLPIDGELVEMPLGDSV
jgi:hypothetical protein